MSWPADLVEALPMTRSEVVLETFCDASFAQQDSKSQSGVMIMLAGQVIAWLSLQQPFIAMSTAEAEMIACMEGVALTQAVQPLVEELLGKNCSWILCNDSVACSAILSYPSGSWRTRHLRLRSKALQELVSDDMLSIHHMPGKYMSADLLTKPLSPARIWELWDYSNFDVSAMDRPQKLKARSCNGMTPVVRVVMVSLLTTPVKAQGPPEAWTWWSVLLKGILGILLVVGFLAWIAWGRAGTQRARPVSEEIDRLGHADSATCPETVGSNPEEHPGLADSTHPETVGPDPEHPCLADFATHPEPRDPSPEDPCTLLNEPISFGILTQGIPGYGGEVGSDMLLALQADYRHVFWGLFRLFGNIIVGFLNCI